VEVSCQLQVYSAKDLISTANKHATTKTTTIQFSFTIVPALERKLSNINTGKLSTKNWITEIIIILIKD
jgi:hypothetical protein